MDKEDIGQIIEMMDQAEDFKPIAKKIVDTVTLYKDEIGDLIGMLAVGIANAKIKMFNTYIAADFLREEAMALTLNSLQDLQNMNNNIARTNSMKK